MRSALLLVLVAGFVGHSLSAGTIQYEVTPLGGNSYQYNYFVSGINFQLNQQLDVQFDPSLYGPLSNGVAPAGFSVTLLDPNNPPGLHGDYSALALVNNPSTAGTFSVQFVFLGAGKPGAQPVFLNQFNSDGFFQSSIDVGLSAPLQVSQAPEPSTAVLAGALLLFGGVWVLLRRRPKTTAA